MSGNVRARRPPSPPPGYSVKAQRFPHLRQDHLDADARREAASKGYVPGRTKSYPPGGIHITSGEVKLLLVIVLVACAVRFYRLSRPNSVVFDEVHFGKFASKYIKTSYFVDVHPPLAKLLITLAGFLFGYDGVFDFKEIGKVYENVPYVAMRMLPATLGVATVPLAYLTVRALDCRATTALLASLFITFENGLVTQSRHILLDSPLIFFTALSTFSWVGFCNEDKHRAFTESWWTWLVLSGLSLGAVLSCKWVGLFTVATVGFNTVYQLWNLLGDVRVTPKLFIKHFAARALCLIVIPIAFYMSMFQIHFLILNGSGDGDGFMSSEFQHTLGGRGMSDTFADISIGSEVTLRHVNTQGGYLHSHASLYPGGSKQQQITLYPHRDHNNDWRIINATQSDASDVDWVYQPLVWITPGMRIRLRHLATDKNLHSHDVRPPVSDVDFQNEVSGYGYAGFEGDSNDDWFVEIEEGDKRDKESSKRLRTLRTKFRLRHALTGCYLFSHKVKLPEWGFEQQEVTCNKNAVKDNSLWMIETNTHAALPPDAPKVNYRLPGFFAKFWELQQVMWTTNNGLTERHVFDSRPDAWPRLRRGINFWVKDHRQIYLLGNIWVWYLSTASVAAYVAVRGLLILRAKRGYKDFNNTNVVKYDNLCGFLFMGWLLHYFPFFIMARQLFLHHYFPALYFAILLSCAVFDFVTSSLRPRVRLQIAAVMIIIAIWNFQHFAPLAYGTPWTKAKCNSAKWLKNWDFSCNDFLDDYSQYKHLAVPTPQQSQVVPVAGGNGKAEIVVDNIAQKGKVEEKQEDDSTSTFINKPEPGRDIFAEPVQDVKSEAPKAPPVEDVKIVSSAEVKEEKVEKKEEKEEKKKEEDKKEEKKAETKEDKTVEKKAEKKVEKETEDKKGTAQADSGKEEKAKDQDKASVDKTGVDPIDKPLETPEGPLAEADLLAEEAAKDLYEEDSKK